MKLSRLLFAAFLAMPAFCGYPAWVQAAPFCVTIQGIQPQCLYFDPSECRRRAGQLSGVCTLNPVEAPLSHGVGPFCVVDSARQSQCIYPDRSACDAAANTVNGVCIENTRPSTQPNPFANNPNQRY